MQLPTIPSVTEFRLVDSRHPSYLSGFLDWEKWRLTFEGGDAFRDKYLEKFSTREDPNDFLTRKRLTPIPAFAKSAINKIRNSIFQRLRDISRSGGSEKYRQAISGKNGGVDRHGSSMNAFLGTKVLSDLLVTGRVGIYVDSPVIAGDTLAASSRAMPYLYSYAIEDILSWSCPKPDAPSEFHSVLLQDTCLDFDHRTRLPTQTFQRYRMLWIDENTGLVNLQFYDMHGNEINREGMPSEGPYELSLTRIPFVMLDLGDSLIKDVCQHQIALLNLASRDTWYALQANFAFLVEQRDLRAAGGHLKQTANADGTATTGGQAASDRDINIGVSHGRAYDKNVNPPAFISPPDEPLRASMDLQDRYEAQIYKLVNLAVETLASRASAESKSMDNQGLEAGLSFIGLVLENGESKIADHWAAYEDRTESRRQMPTIKYPDRYSLKTDGDRIDEATKLSKLIFTVPGRKAKREIAVQIVETLLGGRIDVSRIEEIVKDIMSAKYLTSNPETIIAAVEAGLCGEQTGSTALGFEDEEYLTARKDHAARVERIKEAQASGKDNGDPAARGVNDLSADPANAGSDEKDASRDRTLQDTNRRRVRGKGARNRTKE